MPETTIDVDIGGTFTDCFVRRAGELTTGKAETTEYDLSVGFLEAIDRAAADLGTDADGLIGDAGAIRYSTTVALNTLLERGGSRLGLLMTEGLEDVIYVGRGSQWADGIPVQEQRNVARAEKPEPLVPREMTVGVRERIDAEGDVRRPLDEEHLREQVRYLVEHGARGFAVCLAWSLRNDAHERRVREVIAEEYPDAYLGSAPVFLSSEVSRKRGEYERAMTTLLNAYLHRSMVDELFGIGDELRERGYDRPLGMIHNTGGTAEVFRTAAIDTFNGGPAAALIGSGYLGEQYGYDNVIAADMGGTSFDLSLIVEGSTRSYDLEPVVDRWRVNTTMLETQSIGAGGGSIASVNVELDDRVEVGPESAGANPGPACYNQGGREPTVTDADVLLGYIDPEGFYGGEKQLSPRHAERALTRRVAEPLGVDAMEAARLVREIADAQMGNTIYKETALRGYDPGEFVLFAFGGAGPTHAPGFARHAGVDTVAVFPYAPVFSAFGSSVMDTMHLYEHSVHLPLVRPGDLEPFRDFETFNGVVAELREQAVHDFVGEGHDPDRLAFELELDMKYGGQLNVTRVASPRLELSSVADVEVIAEAFEEEYRDTYSPIASTPENGIEVENFVLKATAPREKPSLPTHEAGSADPGDAATGTREVYWSAAGFEPSAIYDWDGLRPGHRIEGPAIIEAPFTTVAIPPSATYRVDEHLTGILEL